MHYFEELVGGDFCIDCQQIKFVGEDYVHYLLTNTIKVHYCGLWGREGEERMSNHIPSIMNGANGKTNIRLFLYWCEI